MLKTDQDPMGKAIFNYLENGKAEKLYVYSDISDRDEIPIKYLFRSFAAMPAIEKTALKLCKGKVLDVGAAAGSHSLWLSKKGMYVTSIDISDYSVQAMKKRGVVDPQCADFFKMPKSIKFDTLLFLMNGIGIAETLEKLPKFFKKCNDLLNSNGQILLDSSNIEYMFDEEDEKPEGIYYGQVKYILRYNDISSKRFNWLFIDFETLKNEAKKYGFECTKVLDGSHFDYLAKLTRINSR